MTFLFHSKRSRNGLVKQLWLSVFFTTTAISTEHSCPLNIFAFSLYHFTICRPLSSIYLQIYIYIYLYANIHHSYQLPYSFCESGMSLNPLVIYDCLYSCTFVCWHSWNGTWDVWEPSPGISKNEGKLYILLVWICTNEIHSDSIAMCELMMLFLIATPCLKNFRTVRPNKKDPGTKAFLFAWPGKQWLHHITPLVKSERCYQHVDIEETCLQLLMCWLP